MAKALDLLVLLPVWGRYADLEVCSRPGHDGTIDAIDIIVLLSNR